MKLILDQSFLDIICKKLQICLHNYELTKTSLKINIKKDRSEVTEVDLLLSNFLKEELQDVPGIYYSEEDHDDLSFPSKIVDPLDGTKEFIKGTDEWSVSILLAPTSQINDPNQRAVIFQPKTNFIFSNFSSPTSDKVPQKILVSRSEWHAKQHPSLNDFSIEPCGSIALKLAKLANNEALAVCSLRPKNVWDIAAGSVILNKLGFSFYSERKKITDLNQKVFQPPLFWIKDENQKLLPHFYTNCLDKHR